MTARAQARLGAWFGYRPPGAGALFLRLDRGGRPVAGSRLSPSGVWAIIVEISTRASVEVTPHDLRRTFISAALDAGAKLEDVMNAAGHDDPKTTTRYDRRSKEAAAQRVANVLNLKGRES
jgi:integrase